MAREEYTAFNGFEPNPKLENGVILEVGPGYAAVPTFSKDVLNSLRNGTYYVGMDYFRGELPSHYVRFGDYILGDLISLPFRSGSFDQVWLMNVFGAGRRKHLSLQLKEGATNRYLSELSRVIKPAGQVIIGEDNTPAEFLREIKFTDFGFDREIIPVDDLSERFKITSSRSNLYYQPRFGVLPFFIVLTKKLEPVSDIIST